MVWGVSGDLKMEVFGRFGGLQGCPNRCEERLESVGEAVSPPSGPKEGARGAQGTPNGGVGALMVAKSEPGRSQKGVQESQERRQRASRESKIEARTAQAAKTLRK